VEDQRGARIGRQFAALAAVVTGIEHETAVVDALQQHDARRGRAVGRRGGERHRVRRRQFRAQGFVEPALELRVRLGRDVGLVKTLAHVLAA